MLNVLHISDLHYTSAKSGRSRDHANAAVTGILNLAKSLRSQGVLGSNLVVCITGDLVRSGELNEDGKSDFEAVESEFLAPLREILELPCERFFLVPGNHELDRGAVAESDYLMPGASLCENDLHLDLSHKLDAYFSFIEEHGYSSVTRDSTRIAYFEVDGQQIACFNGLVGSYSRAGTGDKGNLFSLGTEFGSGLADLSEFALFLTHHPLSWHTDHCEARLKEFLADRRARLLTGHIHGEGVSWIETENGGYTSIQAGALAEVGSTKFKVAVAWLPFSNSAAVRHFTFDERRGSFSLSPVDTTRVAPANSRSFFERTAAFYDPAILEDVIARANEMSLAELRAAAGVEIASFVPPDVQHFPEDQFSGKRVSIDKVQAETKNVVISGHELSGKSSLLHYLACLNNSQSMEDVREIGITIDFRELEGADEPAELLIKRVAALGLLSRQAEYLLEVGKVRLFVDNFSADDEGAVKRFMGLSERFPLLKWTIAVRGSQRFMPSRAPAEFERDTTSYYQMAEVTLPTVMKMIDCHEDGKRAEQPRAVVERVFRSIHNLSAPRTMFYVRSMLDIFLTDGSVEPLNRYLLIENLISERLRTAHKEIFPGQAVDMEMIDTFVGQLAHRSLKKGSAFVSKAEFLTWADEFIDKKGIQRKRFDPEKILKVLLDSFVLRPYESGYAFIILSIEDYFLAKHMGRDAEFRAEVLSTEGLLTLPSVAEYYIAQNPNDTPRIEGIFEILDEFEKEVAPLIDEMGENAVEVIKSAAPGSSFKLQEELLDEIKEVSEAEDTTSIKFADPTPVGQTKRTRYSVDERGAVFLQLGASILGVTRTLDQEERIKIFQRLRPLLLISLKGIPVIAQHLADGHEVRFRGTNVKADYVGQLAVEENRFYLILRGMLHAAIKNFSTWSGSPSFFNSAVKLRAEEDDELIKVALFGQNIEADLSESLDFIPEILKDCESLALQEILVRLYLDSMTLVPLERASEERAVERLVDVTTSINPPKNASSREAVTRHKNALRKSYSDKLGLNTYIGRRISSSRKKSRG